MKLGWILWCATTMAMAQQLVGPPELNARQAKLYRKMAMAVSAPCCSSGAPVAVHDSGTSQYVADVIKQRILAGDSEKEIIEKLEALTFSEGRSVIFAVPERNIFGRLIWISPGVVFALGAAGIFFFLRRKRRAQANQLTDQELVDRYYDYILNQVKSLPR